MHTPSLSTPRWLALAPLFVTALLGCSPASESATTPATQAAANTAPVPAADPTAVVADKAAEPSGSEDAGAKLQGYIGCYNKLNENAHRTIARYASWVKDMKAGPTGNEKVVYGLYSMRSDSVKECANDFAQAAAMRPALPALDAAGQAYITTLAAMDKQVAEAYTYYDRENYKDDKFAKGKALHVPLAASFAAFEDASAAFSKALDVENDNVLNAQLARIEKTQGRKLPYYQMAVMNRAKQLADLLGEESFDSAAAGTRLEAYEKLTDEALAFVKPIQDDLPHGWSSFERTAEEFRKASKERYRRVRDNVPYTSGERMMLKPGSAWMVDGSVEKLVKAYNDLVEASNAM
ncbi:YiiG family protein [Acidovorax sp.]|uniref:YiiG family protein n=1 Tax=Acidovorax sp. TaxID=1872122 RepID=UPI003919A7B2